MSADRELLELAAKAAGMIVLADGSEWPREKIGWFFNRVGDNPPALYDRASPVLAMWAPLTDDGDALRLAVSLRLHIKPGKHIGDGCTVETQRPGIAGCTAFYDDKAQQMRQAIVRAAAEIGRTMP